MPASPHGIFIKEWFVKPLEVEKAVYSGVQYLVIVGLRLCRFDVRNVPDQPL
ncbi:MAG: hypothetical protein AB1757_26600 [Acidobacteriota bacterium]